MLITKIRKRDGRIVPFDRDKIGIAVEKAFRSVKQYSNTSVQTITNEVVKKLEARYRSGIPSVEDVQDTVENSLIKEGFDRVAKSYILYRKNRSEIRESKKIMGVRDDLKLGLNSIKVLERRYLKKNEKGKVIETPAEMFRRVARTVAKIDKKYDPKMDIGKTAKVFYEMMSGLEFIPNSPTLMNAGTRLGQLSACFVIPIEDSLSSIFDAVKATALIHQSGGGCVSADSFVYTDFCGIEKIGALYERVRAIGREETFRDNYALMDVGDLNIHTVSFDKDFGKFRSTRVTHLWRYEIPRHDQIQIQTSNGIRVTTSRWHPFLVFDGRSFGERRAEDLRIGDILPAPNDSVRMNWQHSAYRRIAGVELDEQISWLLGFYLGDGNLGWASIPNSEPRRLKLQWRLFDRRRTTLEYASQVLSKSFGTSTRVQRDSRGLYSLTTMDRGFIEKFRKIVKVGPGPKLELPFPDLVLKSPLSVVAAFIAGLIDSDGHVDKIHGRVTFSSTSRNLAERTLLACSLIGLSPSMRIHDPHGNGRARIYEVKLASGPLLSELTDLVGRFVRNPLKMERLAGIKYDHGSLNHATLRIPFASVEDILQSLGIETKSTRIHKNAIFIGGEEVWVHRWKQGYGIGIAKLRRIVNLIRPHVSEDFKPRLDVLESLTRGAATVRSIQTPHKSKRFYDMSVADNSTYLAGRNGFLVVHNTGFSFSKLRPRGDVVKTSGGVASGPVSFMKIFDATTEEIKQGGRRRGANMGILSVYHPDIMEFITAKSKPGFLQNFNVSVSVDDKFMKVATSSRDKISLVNPRNGKVVSRVHAAELFQMIVSKAWETGDPGLVFIDAINRSNPTPKAGAIEATNPCVTSDTWILTEEGPRQVRDLIDKKFVAIFNGRKWNGSRRGFFLTGIKPVLRIKTKEGLEVRLTSNHPVLKVNKLTRYQRATGWKEAGKLRPGDKIVIGEHRNIESWDGSSTEGEGYLMGLLIGDGFLSVEKAVLASWEKDAGAKKVRRLAFSVLKSLPHGSGLRGWRKEKKTSRFLMPSFALRKLAANLGLKPGAKTITPAMEQCSSEFYRGFIRGLFDTDGAVQGNQKKGVSIRLAQSDMPILIAVQRMLLRFGIFSRIYENRRVEGSTLMQDGKSGVRSYLHKAQHALVVSNDNIVAFQEAIGLGDSIKSKRLKIAVSSYKRMPNRDRFVATISNIEECREEEVYDTVIPGINAFDANGFCVHNCGEVPLLPYESCNLGSINLTKFVKNGRMDWDKLKTTVRNAVHFLDNVIDVNRYPMVKIANIVRANRKIGLGVMGFAELLIMLGIRYDSERAIATARNVMGFIQKVSHEASEELALARGSFPGFRDSVWQKKGYKCMRNATTTTIAPTGAISIIGGCSSGIEPLFALSFVRDVMEGTKLLEVNPLFEDVAKKRGFHSSELMLKISESGSVQEMKEVPSDIKNIFRTALDIPPEWHVRIQAEFQRNVDNAVSKTINLPRDGTIEDVRRSFLLAWRLKCKGITIYRYGSKPQQVLTIGSLEKQPGEKHVVADSEYAGGCAGTTCPY